MTSRIRTPSNAQQTPRRSRNEPGALPLVYGLAVSLVSGYRCIGVDALSYCHGVAAHLVGVSEEMIALPDIALHIANPPRL